MTPPVGTIDKPQAEQTPAGWEDVTPASLHDLKREATKHKPTLPKFTPPKGYVLDASVPDADVKAPAGYTLDPEVEEGRATGLMKYLRTPNTNEVTHELQRPEPGVLDKTKDYFAALSKPDPYRTDTKPADTSVGANLTAAKNAAENALVTMPGNIFRRAAGGLGATATDVLRGVRNVAEADLGDKYRQQQVEGAVGDIVQHPLEATGVPGMLRDYTQNKGPEPGLTAASKVLGDVLQIAALEKGLKGYGALKEHLRSRLPGMAPGEVLPPTAPTGPPALPTPEPSTIDAVIPKEGAPDIQEGGGAGGGDAAPEAKPEEPRSYATGGALQPEGGVQTQAEPETGKGTLTQELEESILDRVVRHMETVDAVKADLAGMGLGPGDIGRIIVAIQEAGIAALDSGDVKAAIEAAHHQLLLEALERTVAAPPEAAAEPPMTEGPPAAQPPGAGAALGGYVAGVAKKIRKKQIPPKTPAPAPVSAPPVFKYGNTQAAVPKDSEAHSGITALQGKVAAADLAGQGKEDDPHVTVRYGIDSDDVAGITKYLEGLAPFEVKLGKTEVFPPSESSDGAAVVMAPVESPELHQINDEIAKHGTFTEPSFKEYKPHVTVAYVKPDAAGKYQGMTDAEGKGFRIDSVDISDRAGNKTTVKLRGTEGPRDKGTEDQTEPEYQDPWKMTREEYAKEQRRKSLEEWQKHFAAYPGETLGRASEKAERDNESGRNEKRDYSHRNLVRHALEEGRPVPPEVLADYPDLATEHGVALPPRQPTADAPGTESYTEPDEVNLAEHFAPGNIIFSNYWKSYDKVLEFKPGTKDSAWAVKVIHTDKDGNPIPGERPRWHATYPDPKDKVVNAPSVPAPKTTPAPPPQPEAPTTTAAPLGAPPAPRSPELGTALTAAGLNDPATMRVVGRAIQQGAISTKDQLNEVLQIANAIKALDPKSTNVAAIHEATRYGGMQGLENTAGYNDPDVRIPEVIARAKQVLDAVKKPPKPKKAAKAKAAPKAPAQKWVVFDPSEGKPIKTFASEGEAQKYIADEKKPYLEHLPYVPGKDGIVEPDEGSIDVAFARTAGGKIKIGADPKALAEVLGSSLYGKDPATVITKELMQNAWDAIRRSSGQKEVTVAFDRWDKRIVISDTGQGMTRKELETVFTDLGRSGKRSQADASGGFGIAKAAPFMMTKQLTVTTITQENGKFYRHSFTSTPDSIVNAGVDIVTEELPGDGYYTGTVIDAELNPDTGVWTAQEFAKRSRLSLNPPGNLVVTGLDRDYVETTPLSVVTNAKIPGAKVTLHASKDTQAAKQYDAIRVEVNNNGIYQFDMDVYPPTEGMLVPKRIAVDIKATVKERDKDYPFMANREDFRSEDAKHQIREMIKKEIFEQAAKDHKKEIADAMRGLPSIKVGATEIPIFDSGKRLTPEELNELMQDPAFIDLAYTINKVTHDAIDKLGAEELPHHLHDLGKRVRRVGIVFSDTLHGVHIADPLDTKYALLFINPFQQVKGSSARAASTIWHTIKHELIHDQVSGHSENFTSAEVAVAGALGSTSELAAIQELEDVYGDPDKPGGIRPDLDRALQLYALSRVRGQTAPDIFRGEGLAGAGAEGREAGVRTGGEEAVPGEPGGEADLADARLEDALDVVDGDHDAAKALLKKRGARYAFTYPNGEIYTDGRAVVDLGNDGWVTYHRDAADYVQTANLDDLAPDWESRFNDQFWENPGTLYHATPDANRAAIMKDGLNTANKTRGLSNRGVSSAVFTVTDPERLADGSYGDTIIAIDMEALGKTNKPYVEQEPDVAEGAAREALAQRLGLDDYAYDYESGMDPDTVIVRGGIPARYLSIEGEPSPTPGNESDDFPQNSDGCGEGGADLVSQVGAGDRRQDEGADAGRGRAAHAPEQRREPGRAEVDGAR